MLIPVWLQWTNDAGRYLNPPDEQIAASGWTARI
jgi:hypothetical protein